jgi:inhibitor of cysteine peptidase
MKAKLALICAVGVLSLFLFACAPAPKQASVEVSCDDFYQQNHISKEVAVAVGGTVTVTLCSNPSTGFIWSETAQISDQSVLQQTDHKLVMPESEPPPPPGTPGQEVWTFQALNKGTSTVSMEYSRPWEGGEKGEWTFQLTVTVK